LIKTSTSQRNKAEIHVLAQEITTNSYSDLEKTQKLIHWFDREKENFYNIYYSQKNSIFTSYPLFILKEKPYICIRVYGQEHPEWVFTSRCGACEEYSMAFDQLAVASNLTTRRVINYGEDHVWNELYLDGKWEIVDVSDVNRNDYDIGFLPHEFRSEYNMSYVYALYPDGTTEDITSRYRPTRKLTFFISGPDNKPLENAEVSIRSHNLEPDADYPVNLPCITNSDGICSVTIGVGS